MIDPDGVLPIFERFVALSFVALFIRELHDMLRPALTFGNRGALFRRDKIDSATVLGLLLFRRGVLVVFVFFGIGGDDG